MREKGEVRTVALGLPASRPGKAVPFPGDFLPHVNNQAKPCDWLCSSKADLREARRSEQSAESNDHVFK